jgi:hypothetical protein
VPFPFNSPPFSGVRGTVAAGPTCPVERIDHPCPPSPVHAEIDARDAGGRTAASTRTASDGTYALAVPAGSYTLVVVTGAMFPRCPETPAVVAPGAVTTSNITCDTGIR